MSFVPVLPISELPEGAKKAVHVAGREICLYHLSDGIFATTNTCSHAQASLSEGFMEDDWIIQCPRHGARFNIRTGGVQSLPATAPVRTYNTKVEHDMIHIEIEDDDNKSSPLHP